MPLALLLSASVAGIASAATATPEGNTANNSTAQYIGPGAYVSGNSVVDNDIFINNSVGFINNSIGVGIYGTF